MTRRALAAILVPLLVGLTACSGDDEPKKGSGGSTAEVMAEAKKQLDETAGVRLSLSTPKLPDGIAGVKKAEGIATHQPAFEGEIDIIYSGIPATVDVIAVDGDVYVVIPFTSGYTDVNPEEFNAPDPAALMNTEGGISDWLTSATGVTKGDQTRDGSDVLTTYDGKLPGSAVVAAIPSADDGAEFDVSFTIDDGGQLHTASVTGPFYEGEDELTYDVDLDDYGVDKEITAP